MDLSSIPLFQAIGRRMAWLNQRQSVLAENVANADTPGYQGMDLKPVSFADLVSGGGGQLPMAVTDADQLSGTQPDDNFSTVPDAPAESTLSGNTVDLEGEMLKVADTASDYQLVTSIYHDNLKMLKTALGNNSGG